MAAQSLDIADLFGVKGLVAVVTGGGSGIGLMIAQALEANGAIVYIIGRREDVLQKAALTANISDTLQKQSNIRPIQGDVTNKTDLERAVAQVHSEQGYVNVVVANAGIGGPSLHGLPPNASLQEFRSHIWSWDAEAFTNTFAVNTTAVFNTVAAFLELLDEGNKRGTLKQKSQVITTSSIGAFNRNPLLGFAYGGSKAAVVHITKQLSTYLAPFGVRANVIAPGFYPSDMTEAVVAKHKDIGWPASMIPERRPGDEQDIGGAILFLVSKAGAYINGNVLVTDGGRLSIMPATY